MQGLFVLLSQGSQKVDNTGAKKNPSTGHSIKGQPWMDAVAVFIL